MVVKMGYPRWDGATPAPASVAAFRCVHPPRKDEKKLKGCAILIFYKLQNFCQKWHGCLDADNGSTSHFAVFWLR